MRLYCFKFQYQCNIQCSDFSLKTNFCQNFHYLYQKAFCFWYVVNGFREKLLLYMQFVYKLGDPDLKIYHK